MTDPTPVVVSAKRTPQGKENGALADVRTDDLSIPLTDTILRATGLGSEHVEDVM